MSLVPASQEEVQSLQLVISQSPTVAPQEPWLTSQGSESSRDEIHAFLEFPWVVVRGSLPGLVLRESLGIVSLDDRFFLPRGVLVVEICPLDKILSGVTLPSLPEDPLDVHVRLPKLTVSLTLDLQLLHLVQTCRLPPGVLLRKFLLIILKFPAALQLLHGLQCRLGLPGVVDVTPTSPLDEELFLRVPSLHTEVGVAALPDCPELGAGPGGSGPASPVVQHALYGLPRLSQSGLTGDLVVLRVGLRFFLHQTGHGQPPGPGAPPH